jgi:hypothetical protein
MTKAVDKTPLNAFQSKCENLHFFKKGSYFDNLSQIYVTLVDLQLDAQNSYLFTYNTFIKILYLFRALPCSSSGGLRRNCAPVEKELFLP